MIWLQNGVSMVVCFLIARMLIDRRILDQWLMNLLNGSDGRHRISPDLFFLLISYLLSLFFSNTIVVLSLLPLVEFVARAEVAETGEQNPIYRRDVTRLGLALIFGANIGGMGSLIGSPINLAAVTYLQVQKIPGADSVTFFSWLFFGLPISLGLLGLAWLSFRSRKWTLGGRKTEGVGLSDRRKKALWLSALLMLALLTASALQFILKPGPVFGALNPIDLFHLFLMAAVLFIFLLWPVRQSGSFGWRHNLRFLGLTLLVSPLIALRQILARGPFLRLAFLRKTGRQTDKILMLGWRKWFGDADPHQRKCRRPDGLNPGSLVSINRLLYDLPYLGLLLLGAVLALLYLLLLLGDNPATPGLDGWLPGFISLAMGALSRAVSGPLVLLFIFLAATVFLTEVFNNTLVLFMAAPLLVHAPLIEPAWQTPVFLLLTLAASAAFMSPIATPVNAIVSTSLPGFSLRTMIRRGLWLNLLAVGWLFGWGFLAMKIF